MHNDIRYIIMFDYHNFQQIAMRHGDMTIICSPEQYAETVEQLSKKKKQETMKLLGLGGLLI